MEKDELVVGLRGLFVCTRVGLKDVIVDSIVLTIESAEYRIQSVRLLLHLGRPLPTMCPSGDVVVKKVSALRRC